MPSGIAVEIWQKISKRLGIKNDFIPYASSDEALSALENGRLDVLLGPYDLEHLVAQDVNYSVPFLVNSIGIISRSKAPTFSSVLKDLQHNMFDKIVLGIAVLFLVFSLLLFLFERKSHTDFQGLSFIAGFANSMWAITSTFLRDLVYKPVSTSARKLLSIWMLISVAFMIVIASSITASILQATTEIELQHSTLDKIKNKKIGVVKGTREAIYAKHTGNRFTQASHSSELIELVHSGEIDVALASKIIAVEYLSSHPNLDAHLSKSTLAKDLFVFVFNKSVLDLREKVNYVLVELQEDKDINVICDKYLKTNKEDCYM